jgi:hypothetical protein
VAALLERRPDDLPAVPTPPAAAQVVRAAVSPPAVILAAAGVGCSIVGHLALMSVGVGILAWALGMVISMVIAMQRERRRLRPEPIDPYGVPDPWRRFVRESLGAQTRFAEAVGQTRPGPLRDRLEEAGRRIDEAVRECWRVARLGAALDGALANVDPDHTSAELRVVQDQRHELLAGGKPVAAEALDQTESALAARLQSGRRIQAAVQRATDRLRVVTAQLNEAVASAAEVSLGGPEAITTGSLAANIDTVVLEIEALRQALEETEVAPAPGISPPP